MSTPVKKTSKKGKSKGKKSKKSSSSSSSSSTWTFEAPQLITDKNLDDMFNWVTSLVEPPNFSLALTNGEASPSPSSSLSRGNVLPSECVRAALGESTTINNGSHPIVARVSQNERWQVWGGWGSTFPGHLLPTDPEPFSSEDLQTPLPSPSKALTPDDTILNDTWAPPPGFEWAPDSKWQLVQTGDKGTKWIGTIGHDGDKWTYAADMWLLPSHGDERDVSTFARRRLWERKLVVYTPKSKSSFVVDLRAGAGIGLSATLYVVRISPGSDAEKQGVKLGARVVAISGEAAHSLDDFKRLVAKCRERGDSQCVVEYEPFETSQLNGGGGGASASNDLDDDLDDLEDDMRHSTLSQQQDPAMKSALESRRLWQEARREVMKSRKSVI